MWRYRELLPYARDEVVVFNTGAAQRYVEFLARELPTMRRDAVDWERLERGRAQ